jgi:TPR repeat protein
VARGGDRGTLVQGEGFSQGPETSRQRGSSEGNTVATLQPRPSSDQSPPANKATRVLDPEEIKLLMKQGQQLIAAGDVVTARTVFQRAADAGDADAAIALGATYDPNVLAKLGVIGVRADVEKARNWYQRAEILGSPDARGRLDVLADH